RAPPVREGREERLGLEAERQGDVGDPTADEVGDEALDDRHVPDGQHRLGDARRERAQPGSEAADEHDGAHQPPVVAVVVSPVLVSGAVSPVLVSLVPSIVVVGTLPPSAAPSSGSSFAHGGIVTSVPAGTTATANTIPSLASATSARSVM